ncbi:fumarylacetoacetate hydrolase family protein [Aliidiomarina celeris]|uniref:fumarylacetoacetate hydrolase family protein n=1 Tax=Aliidiomarina celeris TaxID=2249428 RepID=UPI000DEB7248|nr:fumarylacetoacetate hydrolase family protein [Aliidiomarina celeris]
MKYSKVVCIGRNYAEHAKELNNPVPSEPLLFIKPADTLVPFEDPIAVGGHSCDVHYELEIAVLIGKKLKNADAVDASTAIDAVGLALDLTLRDLQNQLKAQGHPWEKAKSFDASCPVSAFIPNDNLDLTDLHLALTINGELRQSGHSSQMLTPIVELLQYASRFFTLNPGDVVLTGTPAGVGVLNPGDQLNASLANKQGQLLTVSTVVQA